MIGINDVNFKYIKSFEDLKPFCKKINSDDKKKIIKIFEETKPDAYTSSYVYDAVLEQKTTIPILGYTLGDYGYDSRDVYYFKHYDLKLNDDFINFILKKQ
jgi:hypothetical protein